MDQAETETRVSQPRDLKLIVEKDVQIPMRDGTLLYADIFRPDDDASKVPVIFNIGPYQKDKLWVPPADLEEAANPHMNWETVNPVWWCPRGYAACASTRAAPGKLAGQVGAELVPGRRSIRTTRSNGSRSEPGARAASACSASRITRRSQWRVANMQPPSLKAIMPWEGRADQYRDQALSRRHFRAGLHRQLVAHAHRAPPARRARAATTPTRSTTTCCGTTMRNDLDSRVVAHEQRALGQDHGAALQRRQLGRLLDAPARQHRGLHERRVEAQEAAHPHRHALPSVPFGRRAHRPAALVRSLAEGHRHRDHGRAAGEARDPHRRQH